MKHIPNSTDFHSKASPTARPEQEFRNLKIELFDMMKHPDYDPLKRSAREKALMREIGAVRSLLDVLKLSRPDAVGRIKLSWWSDPNTHIRTVYLENEESEAYRENILPSVLRDTGIPSPSLSAVVNIQFHPKAIHVAIDNVQYVMDYGAEIRIAPL